MYRRLQGSMALPILAGLETHIDQGLRVQHHVAKQVGGSLFTSHAGLEHLQGTGSHCGSF
jgi:hypothetical protein